MVKEGKSTYQTILQGLSEAENYLNATNTEDIKVSTLDLSEKEVKKMYLEKVTSEKGKEILSEISKPNSFLNDLVATIKKRPISTLTVDFEDDLYIVTSADFDIIGSGKDYHTAIDDFVTEILDYAIAYFNEYELYFNAPNRKSHMSSLFKVLLCKSKAEISLLLPIT